MSGTGNDRSLPGIGTRVGWTLAFLAAMTAWCLPARAGIGRRTDPAQVLPLDQIPAAYRETVSEVIREHTLHRQGEPESFPCSSGLYLSLVHEPILTLALWKDLAEAPVQLHKIGPGRYQGEDGAGASATWDYVLRGPRLNVLLAYMTYVSPRSNARIDARILLIVRSGYYREVNQEPYVQHGIEAFVKVDSMGWKTLARTARPMIERILQEQVREAGQFVSLMTKLVVLYPNWATQVAMTHPELDAETRARFQQVVAQDRKPGASTGRPVVMANSGGNRPDERRR
jgi:hypothetical protein